MVREGFFDGLNVCIIQSRQQKQEYGGKEVRGTNLSVRFKQTTL